MKHYQILTASVFAVVFSICGGLAVQAEETVNPVALDSAVAEQLIEQNRYNLDMDNDGIISEEEAENCRALYLNLDNFTEMTDISWLKIFPNVNYLDFANGTITDFSILKELPKLRNLSFQSVPLTDISFVKDLNLETCRFDEMEQITLEQRVSVLSWKDYEMEAGYSADIGVLPIGLLDNYSVEMTLDNTDIANFVSSYHSGAWNEVYAVSEGETAYHIYADEQEIISGSIHVSKLNYDTPALSESPAENVQVFESTYYGNKTAVLRDGILYGIQGGTVTPVQENVQGFDHVNLKNEKGIYTEGDIVLLKDGTLLVNDEEIAPDKTFIEIGNGCAIDEKHKIYIIYPKGEVFTLSALPDTFKAFPYKTNHYYITQDGTLIYYKFEYNLGKMGISTVDTGIQNPVSGYDDMFVDENHDFWSCKTYPSFKATKTGQNAVAAGYYIIKSGGAVYGYLGEDGKVHQAVTDKVYELAETSELKLDYKKLGGFYLHDYTIREEKPLSESEACIRWFLTKEDVLTIAFCDKRYAVSDSEQAICAEYDTETQKGYVYFLRKDGSLWQYCLETEEVIEAVSEQVEKTLKGDANRDGVCNVADVIALHKWLHHYEIAISDRNACDLNNDGVVNIFDFIQLKRLLLSEK